MKWKLFSKKSKKPSGKSIEAISMASLFRWYCYDLAIENPREFSRTVGITPISEEAEEHELLESEKRVGNVEPFLPFLDAIAQINAGVNVEKSKALFENSPFSEDERERIEKMLSGNFYAVSLAALISAFSTALALDIIHRGTTTAAGVRDLEQL